MFYLQHTDDDGAPTRRMPYATLEEARAQARGDLETRISPLSGIFDEDGTLVDDVADLRAEVEAAREDD